MHRVTTVVGPQVSMFELAVPCGIFGIDRPELVDPWYRHRVAAAAPGPHTSPEGLVLDTPYGLDELADADTIVIPARSFSGEPPAELLDALRQAHDRGARLLSVCTGAFVLAAAGLLDGRRATTHWMHAAELSRRYPRIHVDPKVLYIDEGDVMTSAGTAAGIDLMLHVVRLDHGAEVANAVARRLVVPPHRDGGQAQFVDLPMPDPERDEPLAALLGWMLEHLDEDLSVERLARRSSTSPRTFARRFRPRPGRRPTSGSSASGSCWPSGSSGPPTSRSSGWPGGAASAPPPVSASTSAGRSPPLPRPTGGRSGAEPVPLRAAGTFTETHDVDLASEGGSCR